MSTSPAVPLSDRPAPGLGQVERVVDTFIAPSKTFADVLRSSSWWLPFLLMVLSTTALNFVIDRQVGFDRVYANQMASSPRQSEQMDSLEPAQKAQAMARGASPSPCCISATAPTRTTSSTREAPTLRISFPVRRRRCAGRCSRLICSSCGRLRCRF